MIKNPENQYQKIETKREYINYYQERDKAYIYAESQKDSIHFLATQVETEIILSVLQKHFKLSKGNYLDIATGSGRLISGLEKYFPKSIGIDTSKTMLEIAENETKKSSFLKADAENLPFEKNYFDLVTIFRLIINLPLENRLKIFKEIHRVLKRKGIVAVNIHLNRLSLRGMRDVFFGRRSFQKTLSYFQVKKELQKTGFKVVGLFGVNMVIWFKISPFFPSRWLIWLDKNVGQLPLINWLSDALIIFAVKDNE